MHRIEPCTCEAATWPRTGTSAGHGGHGHHPTSRCNAAWPYTSARPALFQLLQQPSLARTRVLIDARAVHVAMNALASVPFAVHRLPSCCQSRRGVPGVAAPNTRTCVRWEWRPPALALSWHACGWLACIHSRARVVLFGEKDTNATAAPQLVRQVVARPQPRGAAARLPTVSNFFFCSWARGNSCRNGEGGILNVVSDHDYISAMLRALVCLPFNIR